MVNWFSKHFQVGVAGAHDRDIRARSGEMDSNGCANAAAAAGDEAMLVRQVHGFAISAALSAKRQS